MAKKEVKAVVKLQCTGGQATPAPPVGPALGQHGVNIGAFVKEFNDRTRGESMGMTIPVEITVYADRSFEFITKSPPASVLIKKLAGLAKGSSSTPAKKAGTIDRAKILEIAKMKANDLNSHELEAAARMIEGTARSMGVDVV